LTFSSDYSNLITVRTGQGDEVSFSIQVPTSSSSVSVSIPQNTSAEVSKNAGSEFSDVSLAVTPSTLFDTNLTELSSPVVTFTINPTASPSSFSCNGFVGVSSLSCAFESLGGKTSELPVPFEITFPLTTSSSSLSLPSTTSSVTSLSSERRLKNRLEEGEREKWVYHRLLGTSSSGVGGGECYYFDTDTNMWKTDGATLIQSSDSSMTCQFNHFTAFAVSNLVNTANSKCEDLDAEWKEVYHNEGYLFFLSCMTIAWLIMFLESVVWFTTSVWQKQLYGCWNKVIEPVFGERFQLKLDRKSISKKGGFFEIIFFNLFFIL